MMKRLFLAALAALTLAAPANANVVAGWGLNNHGELGTGYRSDFVLAPVESLLEGTRKVVSAYGTSYALLPDGEMLAWGGNEAGQIGDGTRNEKLEPTHVRISSVVDIAASGAAPIALRADGTVWAWGGNPFGQLGNGTSDSEGTPHVKPEQVPGLSNVVAVYAGGGDHGALEADGTLCLWGEDKEGQLGDGSKEAKLSPVCQLHNVALVALGGVSSLGGHTLIGLTNGVVLGFGGNKRGQLGIGTTTSTTTPVAVPTLEGATALATNLTHSLAVVNGQVAAAGANADGELGYVTSQTCKGRVSTEVVSCSTAFWPVGVEAQEVSAGLGFSVVRDGERVLSWGADSRGNLGIGSQSAQPTPVEVLGISGTTQISASEYFTLVLAEAAASPDFSITPESRALLTAWTPNLPGTERWQIAWRKHHKPSEQEKWTPYLTLPFTAHEYTVTGLEPGAQYEVRIRRVNSTFGHRIGFGVPLP